MKYGCYLICHEHIQAVDAFLQSFFRKRETGYNFASWITFEVPDANFTVNLMKGDDEPLTQHLTFEVYCASLTELETLSRKYEVEIHKFRSNSSPQKYYYHFAEIPGPATICKIELNYIEDIA